MNDIFDDNKNISDNIKLSHRNYLKRFRKKDVKDLMNNQFNQTYLNMMAASLEFIDIYNGLVQIKDSDQWSIAAKLTLRALFSTEAKSELDLEDVKQHFKELLTKRNPVDNIKAFDGFHVNLTPFYFDILDAIFKKYLNENISYREDWFKAKDLTWLSNPTFLQGKTSAATMYRLGIGFFNNMFKFNFVHLELIIGHTKEILNTTALMFKSGNKNNRSDVDAHIRHTKENAIIFLRTILTKSIKFLTENYDESNKDHLKRFVRVATLSNKFINDFSGYGIGDLPALNKTFKKLLNQAVNKKKLKPSNTSICNLVNQT